MKETTGSVLQQEGLMCPAFLVKDGAVCQVNDAARDRGICVGAKTEQLLLTGSADYTQLRAGRLYLQLLCNNRPCGAIVQKTPDGYLFCMESAYQSSELRALALAAQQLRGPLSTALVNTELLQRSDAMQTDRKAAEQLAQLSRGLHQLLRSVCNMSDAQLGAVSVGAREQRHIDAILDELLSNAQDYVAQSQRKLIYKGLTETTDCTVDAELLNRAVLNLLSNAIKFSPEGSTIQVSAKKHAGYLKLSVENESTPITVSVFQNAFNRFLREPGIEDGRIGIGLGMAIVRHAAAVHGGTVLLDTAKEKRVRVTLTLSLKQSTEVITRSPVSFPGGYTGGIDSFLLELSDVLPAALYQNL